MAASKKLTEKLKNIIKQVSGKMEDFEGALYSEYKIRGTGVLFCLSADNKSFINVTRGISVYIICEKYDLVGRTLIYTQYSDIILIEPDELIELGYD
jgi:hypothetical protein|tara:strand:- start:1894 stop:2184 length:291 start_codon:yes stop_codon:yes gene_type:complete